MPDRRSPVSNPAYVPPVDAATTTSSTVSPEAVICSASSTPAAT